MVTPRKTQTSIFSQIQGASWLSHSKSWLHILWTWRNNSLCERRIFSR